MLQAIVCVPIATGGINLKALLGLIYMHAHTLTHLHAVHTQKRRMSESYSSGISPREVSPVGGVHSDHKILVFTLQAQTQKLTDQPK